LHGASSARSTAPALVVQTPRSRLMATIVFMVETIPSFWLEAAYLVAVCAKIQHFCAPHNCLNRAKIAGPPRR
jgi:hypothetical protein